MQKLNHININDIQIPMIFEQSKLLPIVSLKIIIKACGSMQNNGLAGLSRIAAKMLNEGSKNLGANEFAKCLEDKAISFGTYSGVETFNIELSSLKENFEFGVKMISKLLKEPNITEDCLKKVKTNTKGQILNKKSDFDYLANNELSKLLYPNSELKNPILGDEKSIEQIELKDVKKFLKNIDLSNAFVVIGGDLSEFEAQKYSACLLASFKKGKKREISSFKPTDKELSKTIIKQSEQAYIYFGSPFDMQINSEDAYKAKVMAFILGSSGFGSRLMEEVRVKRGLAYSAYGRIHIEHSRQEFSGYLQTKNENKDEAIKVVKEVVRDFVENGITNEELTQAKKFILGSEPLRNESLAQRLQTAFKEVYSDFELGSLKQELKLIEKLSLKDLNEFIKSHDEINKLSFAIVTNEG